MKCRYIEGSKNGPVTGPYVPVNFYLCSYYSALLNLEIRVLFDLEGNICIHEVAVHVQIV